MMMKSDRSVLSSMFRMTRYVTGMRHVSSSRHVMATYQVQSEEEFQQKVVNGKKPTVVDFSATWCGPCKLLTPRLDAAIATSEEEVDLAIVDIDQLEDIAFDNGVQTVPTVIGFKNGQVVDRFVGLVDEDKLTSFINKLRE